jgi:xanthine dehydrogenase YagR molybdenum-binding subunit
MYIGQGVVRTDGRSKVLGRAAYAGDFRADGYVNAVLVKSTIPAGTITGFDASEAQAMPGVLAIITPQNAEKLHIEKKAAQTVTAPLLQDLSVRYNGQHVAVVVAATLEQALAAGARLRTQYGALNAVTEMDPQSGDVAEPKTFNKGSVDTKLGSPDEAFAAAPVQVDQTYATPVQHHNAMEPHATLARWDGDDLTVWTSTQGITGVHKTLATLFQLKPEQVRVICPYVGGGFGSKGNAWTPITLAAMAARAVGRPVRLVLEREQMYTSNGYRPATIQRVKLGAAADGALLAIRHDGFSQTCRPELGEFVEPVAVATRSLYACPNIGTSHRVVRVNQGLPTYMRAPGEAPGVFGIESAMDELAYALKMDPLALRLKNYAERDWTEDKPFASKALRECYRQAADAFGWERRSMEPRSMTDGRQLVGWGMATSTYPTNRGEASVRIRLLPDGSAVVQCGTQDLGTGTYTVMTQVAADELGLPMERVRAELGDSLLPPAPVSGGSQTTASVTPAIQAAARALRNRLFAMAVQHEAGWQGVQPSDVKLDGGAVASPRGRIPLAELMSADKLDAIEAEASAKPGEDQKKWSAHAFGAQFCEVRIDADLGTIKVSRWVAAFDVGKVMNERTGRSQLIGGITFGIGQALLEETRLDSPSGRYVNANLSEYLVPVNADVPDLQTIIVASDDPVSDSYGAKGMGELPMVGVAPAIANAVFHATGKRVRSLPIRLEDVLA